jgi:rare lipoprotein A
MPQVAEEVGFEPTVDFHLRRFSRPVHSTTLPLLRFGPVSGSNPIRKARSRFGGIRRQFFYEPSKSRARALSLEKGGGMGRFDCFSGKKVPRRIVTIMAYKGLLPFKFWAQIEGRSTMGNSFRTLAARRIALVCIAVVGLAACDKNGEFSLPSAGQSSEPAPILAANAPNQTRTERDVERPDIFAVTDRGIWDGRPSLGGVWVAHPDADSPERVLIRNAETGREITGALFRRERENPGPLLQVSSDAADALGILPGSPTEMNVVVLRREEVEVIAPAVPKTPAEASPAASDSVATVALAPKVAGTTMAVELPPAVEAATAAIEQTALAAADAAQDTALATTDVVDVSEVLSPASAPIDGPRAQVGVYSVEANASNAVAKITAAGIAAEVTPQTMGGRTVWQVVAGPMLNAGVVAQLKALGFVDAFVIADSE